MLFVAGFGEQVVGLGVGGIDAQRRAQEPLSQRPAFLLDGHDTQIVEHAVVAGVQLQRTAVVKLCPVAVAPGQPQVAQREVGFSVGRIARQDAVQFGLRAVQAVLLQVGDAAVVVVAGNVR